MKRLTQKQEGFTQDCFKEVPPGQAYMTHYKVKSMSVADASASRLLKNVKIQTRLEELRQKVEDESVADVLERKQILTEIARGRVGDLLDSKQRIKQGEPLTSAAIQEVNTFDVKIGKEEDAALAQVTKIKLHPPTQAIDLLNKMDGSYAPEKHAILVRKIEGELTDDELDLIARGNNPSKRSQRVIEEAPSP